MFIKVTRAKGHSYAQLVESFRDEHGQPRQRNVMTLGRVDENGGQVDRLLQSLLKVRGLAGRDTSAPEVRFDSALALGDVWALDQLWREIGFDALAGVFRRARYTTPIEQAIRMMVFNRLCDADSKLGVLRWAQTVSLPGVDASRFNHQHLLRAMDALMDHQGEVDACVAHLLRPLIDETLSVVLYDLTTIRAAGLSEQPDDVRQHGMSKEGVIARQFLLGVVQTADGLPIHHEVFDGNASEAQTLLPVLERLLGRFPHIRRLVLVADRGLLSLDNLDALEALELPAGPDGPRTLEYILAVPGRRYGEFESVLQDFQAKVTAQARQAQVLRDAGQPATADETVDEARWLGRRLVVAHQPERAAEQSAKRTARIAELLARAQALADKLTAQDDGQRSRGRALSDSGAKARFFHEVADAHLARIIRVDLKSELFRYEIDAQALARAELMDGKLLLVTNVADLKPAEVVQRYKALADIERGFRVLKSEIEIAPVYHRLPERIRAHASLCFMALILYRLMRQRLKAAGHAASPETALARLRRIQRQTVCINDSAPISGVSTINDEQATLLAALRLKKPPGDTQLNLL
ncbi:IS1634 family transposase [Sphaerotilus sp.]|uniref:IS1634 family transposase n=2 Tax=Sphaerotilus sp. TaxID=2093942 RepID=UPI002ACD49CF|nr:IS1634 family transposase [Sphaerotilus sp.]MDZ7856615.1 IS1634 family transposase [Sphaerotilus sp.]MDZ7857450.1 IS1634 family transposase [Sphaerotilus sp.]MDZ7858810.1 IS1634 family transposase [Sphaerotilus sp.]